MARIGDEITDSRVIDEWIAGKLERVGVDASGWLALYRDRVTGQRWELSYPHSEMHGGGPKLLRCLGDGEPVWKIA